ncbi:MAG: type II secretion system protein [Candidatus Zipacnadales bacterium]
MNRDVRGFNLIEVLIVIATIALLAAIVIPRIWPSARAAHESELRAQLRVLRTSLALFNAHCGTYPSRLEDLVAEDVTGLIGADGRPYSSPVLSWSILCRNTARATAYRSHHRSR